MAVQKNKKTRAKRGTRRSHDQIIAATLSIDPETGTQHRRHHLAADGFYRGKEVIASPAQQETDEEEAEQ